MAGLGIGPDEFALFGIRGSDGRTAALGATLVPKLELVGQHLVGGLSRIAGSELHVEPASLAAPHGAPPSEVQLPFCQADRTWQRAPYLALAVSARHLHARVGARPGADRGGALSRALLREAANLARKGKPFRKLRPYMAWEGDELPELAPAHSAAFWQELAEELAPARGGLDVGVAWTAEEARSLAVGDLLGAFRDLAPLFKLLAAAV